MENKNFGLKNVERNRLLLYFSLGDINKIKQEQQKNNNNLNVNNSETIITKCFKTSNIYITNDYVNYFKIKPFETFVKCQVWDKNELYTNYKDLCPEYPLIADEFFSQAFIINSINKSQILEPQEIALLFNTSLTTAYKIYNLANTNYNLIKIFAINYLPIDYVNFLVKNYSPEVLEHAIIHCENEKLSIYEIPNVINNIYASAEE